ncbi:MAG: DUF4252 domain-containing protein [Bryobacteraceae bacterium]|jgi:hypothetical protein
MKTLLIACLAALPVLAAPQQFQLNLDAVAAKSSQHVDVFLNASTLQLAAKFLDGDDPDEAKVRKLIEGIEGIYVRHYNFKSAGTWTQADLEPIRAQLRGPEWSKIVGVTRTEEGGSTEVWLRLAGNKSIGVAIIATDPKEVTVVNIAGNINLKALAELGGHFGVPKVKPAEKPKKEE